MAQVAPFRLRISLPGQQPAELWLQRLGAAVSDWRPFWRDYFAPVWFRHVELQYASGGAITGDRWAALSVRYAAWKQRHWPGLPIGVLSGALQESLTTWGDSNMIWRASKAGLEVGSKVPWGVYQQWGTSRMPARPPLRVNQTFMLEVGRLLNTYTHDISKKARA